MSFHTLITVRFLPLTQFQELLEKTNNRVTEDREEQEAAAAEAAEDDDTPSSASVRPITPKFCGRVVECSRACVLHVAGRTGVGKRCRRAGLRRRVSDQRCCWHAEEAQREAISRGEHSPENGDEDRKPYPRMLHARDDADVLQGDQSTRDRIPS